MATNKRLVDLTEYKSVLPYASELFGIFQPLLGWRSRRIEERFQEGFRRDQRAILERLKREFAGAVDVSYATNSVTIGLEPGTLSGSRKRAYDSVLLEILASRLPATGTPTPADWERVLAAGAVEDTLEGEVAKHYAGAWGDIMTPPANASGGDTVVRVASAAAAATATRNRVSAFQQQLEYESAVAGMLVHLLRERRFGVLQELFLGINFCIGGHFVVKVNVWMGRSCRW